MYGHFTCALYQKILIFADDMNDRKNIPFDLALLHTTQSGAVRVRRNLGLREDDVVEFCRELIADESAKIHRRGKNWYVNSGGCIITVNVTSLTIITAHKGDI